MDTVRCLGNTPRKKMTPKVMRLRPVLEHRMPTLASKAAFMLRGEEQSALPGAPGRHSEGLLQLQGAPPRSLRDVRAAVTKELKSVTRKVARLEREYYGDRGTVYSEVQKYVYPVKMLMKSLWILDLNKSSEVEEMIRQASNPDRYKGDPKNPAALVEVFTKIQAFMPARISILVDACQTLINNMDRYCVSFYDAEKDCYLETPAHYSEQIAVWKAKAEVSIQSARNLYRKFSSAGITLSMLSSPVAAFCSRTDVTKLLFLVVFADACTHIRSALSAITLWLKTDENYAAYVKNDLAELEKLKEEKMKALRDLKQRCHTLTYSLTKLETDHSKLARAVELTRGKENSLRIDEVSLVNTLNDMELEMEFKEKRRDILRKKTAAAEGASSYGDNNQSNNTTSDPSTESFEGLTSDLKILKERYPSVGRALAQVKLKLAQVDSKHSHLDKARKDIKATHKLLASAEENRDLKEQEYAETEEASQLARRVLLCKTANDATEKLYYSVPFGTKTTKTKGEDKDPISRAFKIISPRIDKDWVSLYRHLPFHPQRGEETVERDIVDLREQGGRESMSHTSVYALERWKRYHTRANVQDLRQALRKVRRFDILKVIDEGLKSPAKELDPFEPEEEVPPPVKPELVPFYRLIERYDQIRASKVKS